MHCFIFHLKIGFVNLNVCDDLKLNLYSDGRYNNRFDSDIKSDKIKSKVSYILNKFILLEAYFRISRNKVQIGLTVNGDIEWFGGCGTWIQIWNLFDYFIKVCNICSTFICCTFQHGSYFQDSPGEISQFRIKTLFEIVLAVFVTRSK